MSTSYWIEARAQRSQESDKNTYSNGHLVVGLFNGKKELNVGYGTRIIPVVTGPWNGGLHFSVSGWTTIVGAIVGTMLFTVVGALMAIVNVASSPIESLTGLFGLMVWNIICVLLELTAAISFLIEFYGRLYHNVLTQEDVDNHWTIMDYHFGFSFWLVVGSTLTHVANIVVIMLVNGEERKKSHFD